MSDGDRIDRLEQRVIALEEMVGRLIGPVGATRASPDAPQRPNPRDTTPPIASARRAPPASVPTPPSSRATHASPLLSPEQWIGQRVLLAVGVIALILAAGYLLRLSFDRGWISPLTRCIGGAISGCIVGAVGWRFHPRYRTYGAALIGCGAAIIYLSVWAAARLYGVLQPDDACRRREDTVQARRRRQASSPRYCWVETRPTPICFSSTSRPWRLGSASWPRGATGAWPCLSSR